MPKISQLNPISQLTTSSILPVVDNGATQNVTLKRVVEFVSASIDVTFATEIELLQSASSITSSLNAFASASILSVATKLSTSSFEAYTASVQTTNTSSLLLTSSFNTFTSSYKTDSGSFDSRIDTLELINVTPFLSSSTFNTYTSSNDGRVNSLVNKSGSFATTGSNTFIGNQKITGSVSILIPGGTATGLNENPTSNNVFWSYSTTDTNTTAVQIGWAAEVVGGGTYTVTNVQVDTPFAPFIAITLSDGSLTLPYRCRINFSKSSKLWEFNTDGTLTGLPSNLISGSSQISNLGFASTSSLSNVTPFLSASTFNTYTSSNDSTNTTQNSRLSSLESNSGSYLLKSETGSFITEAETGSFLTSIPNGIISSSAQITNFGFATTSSVLNIDTSSLVTTSSFNSYTASINTSTSSLNTFTSSINTTIKSKLNTEGVISGSSQILLSSGIYSSSAQLPSGLVSGSSQITNLGFATTSSLAVVTPFLSSSVFNTFATSSNTFTASVNTTTASLNTFSSSINTFTSSYTTHSSSFDSRINSIVNGSGFATTSSFNTYTASINTYSASINTYTSSMNSYTASINSTTASLNGKTGSYATTGSNQFKADQTITGSLTVTALTTISSSISANSSSLYLSSGSNLIVQNNALVEITGSLVVSGSVNIITTSPLQIGTGSGDEGGEILLAKAVTNSTLTGSGITIDSYRDRLRIFEQGGDARGVYIDLAKAPTGVSGELIWKSSGIVNAGTFVTLDNIKATVTTTSNRGLSVATVSGAVSGYISGHYQTTTSTTGGSSSTTSLSTTATASMFSWNFLGQGDTSTYILRDDTNNRVYRIILIIGGSYNNNFISIERLH